MVEKTKEAFKNGEYRDTYNIRHKTNFFFSYIMARTNYIRWDDDVHIVLDQHA
jgi:hypothetical protein